MSQVVTKICDAGAELELSWGVHKEKWLRENVAPALGGYLSKTYPLDESTTVTVRISPGFSEVTARKVGGGYAVTVQSDLYTPIEYSTIYDVREVDGAPKPPPYKRRDNPHRPEQPAYWVGGTTEKTRKVSHVDMAQGTYVIGNQSKKGWDFQDYLVRVCWTNGVWVFISARTDLSGYNLRAVDPGTGQWVLVGSADVGKDGALRSNDLGNVDVSPDGTKFMMTWSAEDTNLGFVKARYVREYAFTPPSQVGRLPSLSAPGADRNIMPVIVDNRQDNGRGDITTTYTDRYGYSWGGDLVHVTFEAYERWDAGEGEDHSEGPFLPDYPGVLVPGTYTSTGGGRIVRSTVTVAGGSYTKSSTSSSTNVSGSAIYWLPVGGGGGPVPITWGPSASASSSITSEDMRLLHFDPRSGAFVTVEGVGSSSYSASSTAADYTAAHTGTWSITDTFGDVTLKLHFGALSKSWVLATGTTISSSGPVVGNWGQGVTTNSPYPVMSKVNDWAPYLKVLFASRRPGEGVFSSYWNTFKGFAVVGQENDAPKFISDDKRGLKKFGEPELLVTQIYPI